MADELFDLIKLELDGLHELAPTLIESEHKEVKYIDVIVKCLVHGLESVIEQAREAVLCDVGRIELIIDESFIERATLTPAPERKTKLKSV